MDQQHINFRIVLDTSLVETKLNYLNLLASESPSLPHKNENVVKRLMDDVVISKTTVSQGKDGVMELKQTVDLGGHFNDVIAGLLSLRRN